ncbi:MAG: HlyC/CorC family transporter [Porticoccaceae bacterium]|nr:HlyC/CorC family transporter [Porticoccaceae bacterium]
MNDAPIWLLTSVLAGLLMISAFFSGSETGMMSLNRYRLKHLAKKSHGARRAQKLLERPDRLIGIILIGNNAVNILASIIASIISIRLFGPEIGIFVATLGLTLAILIFSEVTPKTIAALHPEAVAFKASHILKPLLKVAYPLVWIVNHLSNALVRLLGVDPLTKVNDSLSKEELRTVVDESKEENLSSRHQDMLISVLDLEKISVNDIMVPRNEIFGLNLSDDIDTLVENIINTEHTRLPVYEGDINEIVGILHIRKMSRILRGGEGELTKEAIKRFTNPTYFIPAETPLHIQLINFQKNKYRLGLVVDEYGEIEGLATLDDILEEIVGDFTTNIFESEDEIIRQDDGSYIIDGAANIRDINKTTHWNLPVDGPKTLNGLALEHIESFPDGRVSLNIDTYRLEVLALSEKMISKLKVWQVTTSQEEEI